MIKWYNWNFPAKLLPEWVKEERSRNSKAIIKLSNQVKLLESANCPRCSMHEAPTTAEYCPVCDAKQEYAPNPYYIHICTNCKEKYTQSDLIRK
jgi:hypothetical protein